MIEKYGKGTYKYINNSYIAQFCIYRGRQGVFAIYHNIYLDSIDAAEKCVFDSTFHSFYLINFHMILKKRFLSFFFIDCRILQLLLTQNSIITGIQYFL